MKVTLRLGVSDHSHTGTWFCVARQNGKVGSKWQNKLESLMVDKRYWGGGQRRVKIIGTQGHVPVTDFCMLGPRD